MGWGEFWSEAQTECESRRKLRWEIVRRFDRDYSWEAELWDEQPEERNEAWLEAGRLLETDPQEAIAAFRTHAEFGHPFSMISLGRCYENGWGVPASLVEAQSWYHKALDAGSWHGGLLSAQALTDLGQGDIAREWLEEAVELEHLPSYFWLARALWPEQKQPGVRARIRSLLEAVIAEGHPEAQWWLAALLGRGYYGLRSIPEGFRMSWRVSERMDRELEKRSSGD